MAQPRILAAKRWENRGVEQLGLIGAQLFSPTSEKFCTLRLGDPCRRFIHNNLHNLLTFLQVLAQAELL